MKSVVKTWNQHKALNIIAIMSLVLILLVDFIFTETPELFTNGYELGRFVSNMSTSYLSGFIFYLLIFSLVDTKRDRLWEPAKRNLIKQFVKVHNKLLNLSRFMMVYTLNPLPEGPNYFYNIARPEVISEFNQLERLLTLIDLTIDPELTTRIISSLEDISNTLFILNYFSYAAKPEYADTQFLNESPISLLEKITSVTDFLKKDYNDIVIDPDNAYNQYSDINGVKAAWKEIGDLKDRIFFEPKIYNLHKKPNTDMVVMQDRNIMRLHDPKD